MIDFVFFFQAEDGIRDAQESRGLGDVYKRQEQYLIKTISKMENSTLGKLAKEIRAHYKQHPQSLICPPLMCIQRKGVAYGEHALVTHNMHKAPSHLFVERYDIKGALFNRSSPGVIGAAHGLDGPPPCWQDNDPQTWERRAHKFRVSKLDKAGLMDALRRDLEFLSKNRLYDYSAYMVVTHADHSTPCRRLQLHDDKRVGRWWVHVCMLDTLNRWDLFHGVDRLGSRMSVRLDHRLGVGIREMIDQERFIRTATLALIPVSYTHLTLPTKRIV
eukprot:TRINITY_DN37760_c0_g1_i1.p1 TRINITY_DN37760_c0_g1~~TRINITY_DN37760_c0_g1_i1.p1  ORF type:complete len:274 (+),score=60.66 TRINITY_DN37760_c0_g1_i1:29-850(+)